MKTSQTLLACFILLIGQAALIYAVDLKGEVIPSPADADEGSYWGHSIDISETTLIAGYTWNFDNKSGVYIMERKGDWYEGFKDKDRWVGVVEDILKFCDINEPVPEERIRNVGLRNQYTSWNEQVYNDCLKKIWEED